MSESAISPRDALAILRRFSLVSWEASPGLTLGQLVLTLIEGATPAGIIWASSRLVNIIAAIVTHRAPPDISPAVPWIGALAVFSLVGCLTHTVDWYLLGKLQHAIRIRQERLLLEAVVSIDLVRLEQPETYDLIQRAHNALGYRLVNLLIFVFRIISNIASLIAYAGVLWAAHPLLTLVVALPAIPAGWWEIRSAQLGYIHDYDATPSRRMMAYLFSLLLGSSSGQEVRLFRLKDELWSRWSSAHRDWVRETMAKGWKAARSSAGSGLLQVTAYAGAILLLAYLIIHRRLDLGAYVVLTGAAAAFQGSVNMVLRELRAMVSDLPMLRDLQQFLELSRQTRASAGTLPFPELEQGLEVRHLSFRYPGAAQDALSDVCFRVRPGEIISIVGPNGAGKSTLARLLLGLYRPDSGAVLYDGQEITAIAPAEIARTCAAVFQDFAHFRRPLREELSPGLPALQQQDERLWDLLDRVGLDGRFRSQPRGLDTFLDPSLGGENGGTELSGGEWQKVAIARALARDPRVLVLDEPTASLDPQAEVEVYQNFLKLARGRMTFVISHRIGSARLANRILVIDGGRLIEEGSHEELLKIDGLYARFFTAQAEWYRTEST